MRGTLFCQKVDDLFSRRRLNIPPNLSHLAKLLKIDSCSGWGGGALRVLRGCTYTFFLQIRPEKIFHRPGRAGAPTAPPGYAYGTRGEARVCKSGYPLSGYPDLSVNFMASKNPDILVANPDIRYPKIRIS